MARVDAAIVGLGRWGRTLVEAVQGKSEKLRFTLAVGRDPERLREPAARHGLAVAPDLAAALADKTLGAIVLATPHSLHAGEIAAAAAARKAVFCEKPLALTAPEAAAAIAACEAAGVVLGIGHDKRWFPSMQELFRVVEAGTLGPLLHAEAHFSNEVSARMFSPWRHSETESPAGGMTGTGVHVLDALVHMLGPVRRAWALQLTHKPPPDPLDSLACLLEFDARVSGTLAAVRSTPFYWRVHVFGRAGSAEALGRGELILRIGGKAPQRREFAPIDTARANLEAFADAVLGDAPYPIPTREMLATVAAFEAIAKSAQAGGSPVSV